MYISRIRRGLDVACVMGMGQDNGVRDLIWENTDGADVYQHLVGSGVLALFDLHFQPYHIRSMERRHPGW